MKFALDSDGRFQLQSVADGGWELIVDGKMVHYCLTPVEAVTYMSETLRSDEIADGVEEVVAALARVQEQVEKAVEAVKLNEAARLIVPLITPLASSFPDRREVVRDTSLRIADCSLAEFKVRGDRKEIVNKAKIILEPWFEQQGLEHDAS